MERDSRSAALRALRRVGGGLQRLPRRLAWIPVLAWVALIWYLSSQSSDDEPSPPWLGFVSNLAHAPLFGLLALWLALLLPREGGWPRLTRWAIAGLLAGVVLYGVADELHQSTVEGRDASLLDIITDGVGAACTLWIVHYVGGSGASEGGLWKRLALGVLACATAALCASVL